MKDFDLRKYLTENKLLKEDIKFNDYVEVNQTEFDRLYDRLEDEFDGSVEDFVEEYGRDFLGPNIEAINQYYGAKVYADDVIEDFFIAGGVNNISSNEEFEAWLDKNREFYLAENKFLKEEVSQWLINSFIAGVEAQEQFGEKWDMYATEGEGYEKLMTAAEETILSTDSGDATEEELIAAAQLQYKK